jgi:pSer/pThr/pTyr-binding forkhead associated (FHA) protein
MPKLTVSLPDAPEKTHDLTDDTITIGRVEDNALQIEDISVSSRHATLTLVDGDYVLRDIGSTNGTRLNGKQIDADTDHRLRDGDSILFGKIDATYQSDVSASTEARPLPTQDEPAMAPAAASVKPADFANASPFQTKAKKKDPAGKAIIAFAILAILAFLASVATVMSLSAPSLPS